MHCNKKTFFSDSNDGTAMLSINSQEAIRGLLTFAKEKVLGFRALKLLLIENNYACVLYHQNFSCLVQT